MIRTYTLVGNYRKLFDAKRGRVRKAREVAMLASDILLPKFVGYSYDADKRELYVEWTDAPTYLDEDELFDLFDEYFNNAQQQKLSAQVGA